MSDEQEIRDNMLRFGDAVNRVDIAQFEATWAPEATWIIDPPTDYRSSGPREEIASAFGEALRATYESFVQIVHGAVVEVDGDRATARGWVTERGILIGGEKGYFNHGVYDDQLIRTGEGWRFSQRHYQYLYVDDAPLPGRGAPLGGVL
jgi:ketosteroid isomerase-like protein